jgi:hypothetical protein
MNLRWPGMILMAALLMPTSVCANWTSQQLSGYTADCIESCQKNPNVHVSKRNRCADYCRCTSDEGQRRFTADDFDEMTRDALAGKDSAKLKELHSFVPECNKRSF